MMDGPHPPSKLNSCNSDLLAASSALPGQVVADGALPLLPLGTPLWANSLFYLMKDVNRKLDAQNVQLDAQKVQLDAQNVQLDAQKVQLDAQKVQLDAQKVQLDAQKVQFDGQKIQLDRIDASVKKLEFRSATERTSALVHNGRSINGNAPLRPVPHPDTGSMPPAALQFPGNLDALRMMQAALVDGFLDFYGILQPGLPIESRRRMLAEALGCSHAC